MTINKADIRFSLDAAVDEFESALAAGEECLLSRFLPERNHPDYEAILLELIRVDLERSWDAGECRRTEDYCLDFPDVLSDADYRSLVAYEEYRARLQAGDPVDPEELRKRLAISISEWPRERSSSTGGPTQSGVSLFDDLPNEVLQLRIAEAFPEFHVIEELGRGTFGCVFLAKQRGLSDRLVAIKITADTTLEPERLACLQHTAIVPVYSVHRAESWQAMCMPYFGRETFASVLNAIHQHGAVPRNSDELESWIRSSRTAKQHAGVAGIGDDRRHSAETCDTLHLESPQGDDSYVTWCCHVVAETAAGLQHAHERGILHRDIKPENILLADDGRPMLLDFNLSSHVSNFLSGSLVVGGTLPYLAPEQLQALLSGSDVGPQADVYSLGVILFELLTGRLPFPVPDRRADRDEFIRELIQQRQAEVPMLNHRDSGVPPAVAAIVQRCLNPVPGLRYGNARELSEDLVRDRHHLPLQHTPNPSRMELLTKWRRRHPRVLSLSSLIIFGCIAAVLTIVGWFANARHVAHLETRSAWHQFQVDAAEARTLLSVPEGSNELLRSGTSLALSALRRLSAGEDGQSLNSQAMASLSNTERNDWTQTVGELSYLLASARLIESRAESSSDALQQTLAEALLWNSRAVQHLNGGSSTYALNLQLDAIQSAMGKTSPDSQVDTNVQAESDTDIDQYVAAVHAVADGHASDVLPSLEELVNRNPTDYSMWFLKAKALAQAKRPEAAEAAFTTCIAFQPDCWRAWLERGIVRQLLQRDELAARDFSHVIELRPDIAAAWLNRALSRRSSGKLELAIADLNKALELGGPTRCWFIKADCHHQLGDVDAARAAHETGLKITPNDDVSWVSRGIAQLQTSPQNALTDFESALKWNPLSRDALQNIAHVQSEVLQRPDLAIVSLDRIIERLPTNAHALASRAVLHARMQNSEAALRDAQAVIKLPRTPLETYQVACVYSLLPPNDPHQHITAIRLLKQALHQDVSLAHTMARDSDLANLHGNPELQKLIAAAGELDTTN